MSVIDIRIMAHPARRAAALSLCARLARYDPMVVWDTARDAPPSAMRTARAAWAAPPRGGATHVVVLQDDVSVPADFGERLTDLLVQRPSHALGLFAGWGSRTGQVVRFAAYLGLAWAPVMGTAVSATGISLPAGLAGRYAAFLEGQPEERDSMSMYNFLVARRVVPIIAVPNLVEHDRPYRPSLWPEKMVQGPRRSACFVPEVGGRRYGGLDRVDVVPHLSSDRLRSQTWRSGPATGRSETLPSWRYANRLGFETRELLRRFGGDDLAGTRRALSAYLDPAFQYDVWLTAFLTGLTLGDPGRAGEPDPHTAPAKAASRTLVAGCLSRVMVADLAERVAAISEDLVGHALACGLACAPAPEPVTAG
jgi:hypothetical protein